MKYPPYPHYKPSGIEWLGEVPEHWSVSRIKWSVLGTFNGIWGDEPNGVDDIVCVRVADFDRERFVVIDEPATLRAVEPSQRKNRLLRKGDLLIEKSGGGEKQLVGCVVHFDRDFKAVCSNFVARMPATRAMHPRFWCYVHAALYAGRLNYPAIKQTTGIQNLDASAYLNEMVGFPEFGEQRAIATFLDAQTAKLDSLVEKKWTLIERLEEKRTALTSQTVTRGLPPRAAKAAGLDPRPKLKPSGTEWLGDVPSDWSIGPIKALAKTGRRTFTDGDWVELPFITDEGVRLIQTGNVGIGQYREQGFRYISDESFGELGCTEVKPNDVLVCRLDGPVGRACLAPDLGVRMITSVDNTILKVRDGVSPRFFVYFFSSAPWLSWIDALCRVGGGFRVRISRTMLGNLRVPIPPFHEQHAIAEHLDHETAKIDQMVAKVEAAIERLQEYRTALIAAAVTGKIDVRGLATAAMQPGPQVATEPDRQNIPNTV